MADWNGIWGNVGILYVTACVCAYVPTYVRAYVRYLKVYLWKAWPSCWEEVGQEESR